MYTLYGSLLDLGAPERIVIIDYDHCRCPAATARWQPVAVHAGLSDKHVTKPTHSDPIGLTMCHQHVHIPV